jgi:hypothetical protein
VFAPLIAAIHLFAAFALASGSVHYALGLSRSILVALSSRLEVEEHSLDGLLAICVDLILSAGATLVVSGCQGSLFHRHTQAVRRFQVKAIEIFAGARCGRRYDEDDEQ